MSDVTITGTLTHLRDVRMTDGSACRAAIGDRDVVFLPDAYAANRALIFDGSPVSVCADYPSGEQARDWGAVVFAVEVEAR